MSGTIDHVNVSLKIDSLLLSALDLDTATDPLIINQASTLSNGTSAAQASRSSGTTRARLPRRAPIRLTSLGR
jgi:hypothetical protein